MHVFIQPRPLCLAPPWHSVRCRAHGCARGRAHQSACCSSATCQRCSTAWRPSASQSKSRTCAQRDELARAPHCRTPQPRVRRLPWRRSNGWKASPVAGHGKCCTPSGVDERELNAHPDGTRDKRPSVLSLFGQHRRLASPGMVLCCRRRRRWRQSTDARRSLPRGVPTRAGQLRTSRRARAARPQIAGRLAAGRAAAPSRRRAAAQPRDASRWQPAARTRARPSGPAGASWYARARAT